MPLFTKELGIDLGTVNTLVCENGEVVLHEPTVVAIATAEGKIVEVGQAARDMYGRAPDTIEVMRPLRDGVIADYEVTQKLLEFVIAKVCGPFRLFRPRVIITVPYGVTSVESRAVQEATLQAGAREAFLIPEPLAGAIGADLPVSTPTGNMVVDLGGGCSEAAVVSMNGIVSATTVRVGIDTNLTGVFQVCRAAADRLAEGGRIVNMASISGVVGFYGQVNYSAAKAGVIAITKVLSKELARRRITVNAVAPGVVLTEMGKSIPEEVRAGMIAQIPLGRFGEPEEISNVILFLCSDLASYVTGQTIHANGGWIG